MATHDVLECKKQVDNYIMVEKLKIERKIHEEIASELRELYEIHLTRYHLSCLRKASAHNGKLMIKHLEGIIAYESACIEIIEKISRMVFWNNNGEVERINQKVKNFVLCKECKGSWCIQCGSGLTLPYV
jgi:hypothetical protein